jgi:uncharacterized membrane protein (UPF0127 family)
MKYIKPKIIPTIILLIILCIVFFFIYLKFYNEERQKINTKVEIYETTCGKYQNGEVDVDGKQILVDISDNTCKRDLGLSGRTSMNGDTGMIFIFDKMGRYGFWMKDMKFALDIIWIDNNFKIIGIEKDLSPSTYPESFGGKYIAKYVLEIPAGYTEKNNIKVGDQIVFTEK